MAVPSFLSSSLSPLLGFQIESIKKAAIPDVDLSTLGSSTFGSFTVEVIDPVADYLELLEV